MSTRRGGIWTWLAGFAGSVLRRRRLRCPEHGVRTEGVPFARDGSGHTRDFEDLVAWLVTKTDKTTVAGFARTSWRTVGAICERVAADVLDPDRLCGLVDIGVDEISWRKHHRYLPLGVRPRHRQDHLG